MRHASFWLALAGLVCLVSTDVEAAARHQAKAPPAAQSREALYAQCQQMVFRKFGWHDGTGRTVMYTFNVVEQTDYCVRNGGKI